MLRFSVVLCAQIRIVDFDKSRFKNGIVYDQQANWTTLFSRLSPREIDGTPSLVIDYRSVRPFGSAESGYYAGGCKYLSFDYKRLDGGNCEVMVWVNDKIMTTIDQANGLTQSVIKLPVFMSGPIRFKFFHAQQFSTSDQFVQGAHAKTRHIFQFLGNHQFFPMPNALPSGFVYIQMLWLLLSLAIVLKYSERRYSLARPRRHQ